MVQRYTVSKNRDLTQLGVGQARTSAGFLNFSFLFCFVTRSTLLVNFAWRYVIMKMRNFNFVNFEVVHDYVLWKSFSRSIFHECKRGSIPRDIFVYYGVWERKLPLTGRQTGTAGLVRNLLLGEFYWLDVIYLIKYGEKNVQGRIKG